MAVLKLLNLLAISCLAVIASLAPAPAAALSVETNQPRQNLHRAIAAKKKRATSSKRCKPRSTPAPAPASTSSKTSSKTSYSPKPTNTSSSSSTNSNSGSSGAGKAGIAWAQGNDPAIKNFISPKVSRYYTWSPFLVPAAEEVGMNGCPMLWGTKQTDTFKQMVKPGYANCAMGFNEPNQSGQSDMSPTDGAQLWRQYLDPLQDQGYFLVTPACTNAPSGKTWMKEFFDSCKDCHFDALATHWYGTDYQDFINHATDYHNTFGYDIWVTEFACQNFSNNGKQCSYDDVFTFMRKVTSWMDDTQWIGAYFAFGALHDMGNVEVVNQLLGGDGKPTALGELYIGNSS